MEDHKILQGGVKTAARLLFCTKLQQFSHFHGDRLHFIVPF